VSTCHLRLSRDLVPVLSEENARRYRKLRRLDLNGWLREDVLSNLELTSRLGSVVLQPTCGCVQTGSDGSMLDVARACAEETTVPIHWNCCGTAGDRGFLHPELTDGAQRDEQEEVALKAHHGYYSVAGICEIDLSERLGESHESIAYLVERATRP
jgi:D-lactate dehydrogenase